MKAHSVWNFFGHFLISLYFLDCRWRWNERTTPRTWREVCYPAISGTTFRHSVHSIKVCRFVLCFFFCFEFVNDRGRGSSWRIITAETSTSLVLFDRPVLLHSHRLIFQTTSRPQNVFEPLRNLIRNWKVIYFIIHTESLSWISRGSLWNYWHPPWRFGHWTKWKILLMAKWRGKTEPVEKVRK